MNKGSNLMSCDGLLCLRGGMDLWICRENIYGFCKSTEHILWGGQSEKLTKMIAVSKRRYIDVKILQPHP